MGISRFYRQSFLFTQSKSNQNKRMWFDGKKHLLPFGFWLFFSFLQKFFGYLVKSKQTLQFDGKIQLLDFFVKILWLLSQIKTNFTIWRKMNLLELGYFTRQNSFGYLKHCDLTYIITLECDYFTRQNSLGYFNRFIITNENKRCNLT